MASCGGRINTVKIFGPPGTGKTRTLLELLEKELTAGIPPERIAFLTFTRAARLEALSRCGQKEEEMPYLRTIHAICYRQLGLTKGQMVTPADLRYFGSQIGLRLTGTVKNPWSEEGEYVHESPTKGDLLVQLNHLGRHRQVNLNTILRDAHPEIDLKYAKWFTLAYRAWKDRETMYDYTDLLTEYLANGRPLPIDVLFVDEAQDLSALQWAAVLRLGAEARRIFLAGDDDQSIFSWAGADPLAFLAISAEERVLSRSHRLPREVHALARHLASRIGRRKEKEFAPRPVDGEVTPTGHLDEYMLQGPSTLVLYRNHHRGNRLAQILMNMAMPFHGSQFSDPEVRSALTGWYAGVLGREITPAQARALARFAGLQRPQQKSPVKFQDLFPGPVVPDDWARRLGKLPAITYLSRTVERWGWQACLNPTVSLLSIHQSKGREANTVILDLEMARATWDGYQRDPDDEHRVWYVGVTRARDRLFTLLPGEPLAYPLF